MAKHVTPPTDSPGASVQPTPLREALEERYLAYALSTIMGRALPDARDGLKPVHRRILYGMQILKLDPSSAFKKSAKIVGDVMGSFHPHGDQAIYDALVRLAQDFSSRYPLVEGQGNFGNIDGDSAAAYRYTEARMTEFARLLLEGIDEDAIDFRENYSGDTKEPVVLPAAIPNLLANGSQGIAVGMATSIPPHNLAELCDAALHLIDKPNATVDDLLNYVPGPDFPTGGVLIETRENIAEAYRTGRGGFRLRARWSVEEGARGTWVAVVTEIPYGVQKSRLMEKLAEQFNDKKLPLVADMRDESAEDVRVVFEPRSRAVDPATMMETLFRASELEVRVPLNMNVLVDGVVPKVVDLADALRQWLDHRRVVLQRRSRHRLTQIEHRLEVLSGMIVAYLNLDEVIRIIREEDEPKESLKAAFKLTDVQANYILDTRLRSLRKLEEMELRREHEELKKEKAGIETLLGSDAKQWRKIAGEIGDLKKRFGPKTKIGARRTLLADAPAIDAVHLDEMLVEREPITVVLSEKGWIRALKGHVADVSGLAFKGDDRLKAAIQTETTAKIVVLATNGKAFTLEASKLPGGRGFGEPLRLMAEIDEGADVALVFAHRPGAKRLIVSTQGRGFVVGEDEMIAGTRKGRAVLNVDADAELKLAVPVVGDHVAIVGENRKLLVYPLNQTPEMPRGKGVRLQRYIDGGVSDAKTFALKEGLTWLDPAGRTFTVHHADLRDWIGNRSDAGRLPPKGFPKSNRFA